MHELTPAYENRMHRYYEFEVKKGSGMKKSQILRK
jgi:hypothetical protein